MDNIILVLQIVGFIITALSAGLRFLKWVRAGHRRER